MKNRKIFDVSILIEEGMINYPGNPQVRFEEVLGKTSKLTELSIGTHSGTHIDAPRHVIEGGGGVDEIDINAVIGECEVFDLSAIEREITVRDLEGRDIKKGDRVLFKTSNSARGFGRFFDDYVYLSGNAAEYLAEIGVALVGVDALSVKQKGSSDLRAHELLLRVGVVILEGVNLFDIKEGRYNLIALPLRLKGLDGSPVRAVLEEIDG